MKKFFLVLLLSSAFAISQDFKKVGTTGYVFLEIPVSAKASGIGGTLLELVSGKRAFRFGGHEACPVS